MINQSGSKNTSASIWQKSQSEEEKQVSHGDKMSSLLHAEQKEKEKNEDNSNHCHCTNKSGIAKSQNCSPSYGADAETTVFRPTYDQCLQ